MVKKILLIVAIALIVFVSGCTQTALQKGCGNGSCDAGENTTNCPNDCPAGTETPPMPPGSGTDQNIPELPF